MSSAGARCREFQTTVSPLPHHHPYAQLFPAPTFHLLSPNSFHHSQPITVLTVVDAGFRDITDSGRLDHVADSETLDCLVLGSSTGAVAASHEANVTATALVAAVIATLLGHLEAMDKEVSRLLIERSLDDGRVWNQC